MSGDSVKYSSNCFSYNASEKKFVSEVSELGGSFPESFDLVSEKTGVAVHFFRSGVNKNRWELEVESVEYSGMGPKDTVYKAVIYND